MPDHTYLAVIGALLIVLSVMYYLWWSIYSKLEDMDRQARAYGWEVGRGHPMTKEIISREENPFLWEDWREFLVDEDA